MDMGEITREINLYRRSIDTAARAALKPESSD